MNALELETEVRFSGQARVMARALILNAAMRADAALEREALVNCTDHAAVDRAMAAGYKARADVLEDALSLLLNVFRLGGEVRGDFGSAWRAVDGATDVDPARVAAGRIAECGLSQETPSGMYVAHVFDRHGNRWGSHS